MRKKCKFVIQQAYSQYAVTLVYTSNGKRKIKVKKVFAKIQKMGRFISKKFYISSKKPCFRISTHKISGRTVKKASSLATHPGLDLRRFTVKKEFFFLDLIFGYSSDN